MPNNMYEAVVFFDDGKISKEMRFSEFEAVLDGYVGVPEFALRNTECCYLQLNKDLSVRSAVFFLLKFDNKGMPDSSWDIPIEMMARDAAMNPDLGSDGICKVSKSNCPVPQYDSQLWEPESEVINGQLKSAIQRNKLAFKAEKPVENIPTIIEKVEGISEEIPLLQTNSQDMEKRVDRLKAAYKKKLHTFEGRRKQEVEHVVQLLQKERRSHHESVEKAMAMIEKLAVENSSLKEDTSEHKSEVDQLQAELSIHLNSAQEEITGQQKSLDRMANDKAELEQVIEKQKNDIIDFQDQISELNNIVSEIPAIEERFQSEKESIVIDLIDKLVELDIVFVAYSSGAGHMSLAANKMMDYLEHPIKYAAEKCNVSEKQYKLWESHFNHPVCDECGERISKVLKPAEFHKGIHNRCIKHKRVGE